MFGRDLKLMLALVLIGVVTVAAMACGTADDSTATIGVTSGATHEDTVSLTDDHDGDESDILDITLVVIEGREWGFDPPLIEIPVGHRVRLTLVNDGRAEHDVEIATLVAERIEAAGVEHGRLGGGPHTEDVVATHAMPGTESSVLFTATKAGRFEFACTILGHREAGMVGTIVVTDNA